MDSSRLVSAIYIHYSARLAIRYDSNRSSRIRKIEQNDRERRSGNDIHRFRYINAMSEGVTRCSKWFSRCRTIETGKIIPIGLPIFVPLKRNRINIFFLFFRLNIISVRIDEINLKLYFILCQNNQTNKKHDSESIQQLITNYQSILINQLSRDCLYKR